MGKLAIHGPKPFEFIGKLISHGPKPYEFKGKLIIQCPKPYEFIGKLAIHGPKPYEFIGAGTAWAQAQEQNGRARGQLAPAAAVVWPAPRGTHVWRWIAISPPNS